MTTHSSTLAWKIPWTEEPGRLESMVFQESDSTEQLHFALLLVQVTEFTQIFLLIKSLWAWFTYCDFYWVSGPADFDPDTESQYTHEDTPMEKPVWAASL